MTHWFYLGEITITKRTTISLSSADLKQLKELANEERRPVSCQIIYMMEFYQKHRLDEGRENWDKSFA